MKPRVRWVWLTGLLCLAPSALVAARGPDGSADQAGHVDFADHDLRVRGDAYEVRSRWHFAAPPRTDAPILLQPPLPEGAVVVSDDFAPMLDARGRVHALRPLPRVQRGGAGALIVQGRLGALLSADRLPVPMPDDDGLHRVAVDPELRYAPASGLGLDNHMGIQVASGVSRARRRALDQHFDGPHAHRRLGAIYALADGSGLRGAVAASATHRLHLTIVALLAFGLSVFGLWALYRRMQRRVKEEEVDRYLARELESFDAAIDRRRDSLPSSDAPGGP